MGLYYAKPLQQKKKNNVEIPRDHEKIVYKLLLWISLCGIIFFGLCVTIVMSIGEKYTHELRLWLHLSLFLFGIVLLCIFQYIAPKHRYRSQTKRQPVNIFAANTNEIPVISHEKLQFQVNGKVSEKTFWLCGKPTPRIVLLGTHHAHGVKSNESEVVIQWKNDTGNGDINSPKNQTNDNHGSSPHKYQNGTQYYDGGVTQMTDLAARESHRENVQESNDEEYNHEAYDEQDYEVGYDEDYGDDDLQVQAEKQKEQVEVQYGGDDYDETEAIDEVGAMDGVDDAGIDIETDDHHIDIETDDHHINHINYNQVNYTNLSHSQDQNAQDFFKNVPPPPADPSNQSNPSTPDETDSDSESSY